MKRGCSSLACCPTSCEFMMYNVHKMLSMDSSPIIRLKKRIASLTHTHNTANSRTPFITDANINKNRQLMENLIQRLQSVDSKCKKNKRVANRAKLGSPKRSRTSVGRPADMYGSNCPTYPGFQSKLHTAKRMNPRDFREGSDSAFLQGMKELPPLHPTEVENVLGDKDHVAPKVEPIFPPPPDPSCNIVYRTSTTNTNKSPGQRPRKSSVSYLPSTGVPSSNLSTVSRMCTLPVPVTVPDHSYPYVDLRTRYDPNFYAGMQSPYDQFGLLGLTPDSNTFNAYARSSAYSSWDSLGKCDQGFLNRATPSTSSMQPMLDRSTGYRAYPSSTNLVNSSNYAAAVGIPFPNSFQNETFVQSMQSYSAPIDPQQSAYGMNLSLYNYPSHQPPLPPAHQPPNTTSYM